MAITEFFDKKHRGRVAFFGVPPDDEALRVFKERAYLIDAEACSEAQLKDPQFLMATDSVIFFQNPDKPTQIDHQLQSHAKKLLNYDCRIYVRVAKSEKLKDKAREIVVNTLLRLGLPANGLSPNERQMMPLQSRERDGRILAPYVYVCDTGMGWLDIAQTIIDNPAGEQPGTSLQIVVTDTDGDGAMAENAVRELLQAAEIPEEEVRLLIQRAFHDCLEIRLRQLSGGLSGGMTFHGHYRRSDALLGSRPSLACFVKIGTRKQIEAEYASQLGVAVYLPFHLAPRLDLKRCGLGAGFGILVGDFVSEAEPLSDCARQGRAVSVIGNLFNKSLSPWIGASTVQSSTSLSVMLSDLLPKEVPAHRKKMIAEMGAKLTETEMRSIFTALKSGPVRVGLIHGDLHAKNVLVRGSDALLIDFEKSNGPRPLVYDAASLEAGLLVEGFLSDARGVNELHLSIAALYDLAVIIDWIEPCNPHDRSSWYYECVKQIRMYARQLECEPGQYASALALALFKKSCNPTPFKENAEFLRSLAYVLAEKILVALAKRN